MPFLAALLRPEKRVYVSKAACSEAMPGLWVRSGSSPHEYAPITPTGGWTELQEKRGVRDHCSSTVCSSILAAVWKTAVCF